MTEQETSLGQLIWLVRRELEWAREIDDRHPLKFDVDQVELDVDVEVCRARTGQAGLDLKVIGVGGSASGSREATHATTSRVHVVLTPQDTRATDAKYQVSAEDTEPPPRRADLTTTEQDSAGVGADAHGSTAAATNNEPGPGER